ncbi:hypothetical protein [Microvirga sp. G4-2]|uniref:hypothetical protein n=1 Tax=Microvirga sp. G4-2 TaxID=3434467 RepID=UPI004043FE7A
MRRHAFPGAFAAAALGVAVSGSSIPDLTQDLPARCLPQETRSDGLQDGCNGFVTFGMTGPMVMPGQAPEVEATGSISRNGKDDAAAGHTDLPE